MTDTPPSGDGTPQSNDSLRIFVVDDHPSIRKAVIDAVESTLDMTVCGEASAAEEAFQKIGALEPNIAVIDLSLTDAHDLELVEKIHAHYPDVKTVVFSAHDETVFAERAVRAGASGYLTKGEPTKRLIEAVRAVGRGEMYLSRRMASRILSGNVGGASGLGFPIDELTDREMDVFELVGKGYSVDEICDELDLHRKTVETYRRRAKEKLDLDSVSDLLQYALRWIAARDGTD